MSADEKRKVLARAVELKAPVTITLDARREGVDVPEHLRGMRSLVLAIEPGNPNNNRNLVVGELAFDATMSFRQRMHHVVVPWAAVYAIGGGGGVAVFTESVPEELRAQAPTASPRLGWGVKGGSA